MHPSPAWTVRQTQKTVFVNKCLVYEDYKCTVHWSDRIINQELEEN